MRASALLVVLLCGCNAVWGIEGGTPLADAGDDVANDPCSPTPGVAKVCVKLKAERHPTYDVSTGAPTVRIDGKGVFHLFVYDKDPADPKVGYSAYLRYPEEGAEASVDETPTLVATVPAGKHWFIARFEDNKVTPRTDEDFLLAGDHVTVPTRTATGKYVYASADALDANAIRLDVSLLPMRRIDVSVVADASLRTAYKDYAVNGDGPLALALYDGDFDTAWFLDFVGTRCYSAAPMTLSPTPIQAHFATTVIGTHRLAVSLEDYDSTSRFPTAGSLICPTDATGAPMVNVTEGSWTSTVTTKFTQIVSPYRPGEKVDEQRCP